MKRIVLSLAVLFTLTTAALAGNEPITNAKAKETFSKEFSGAEFVKWSQEGKYIQASFVFGGTSTVALFNENGELLGSVRDLLYNQLPMAVITAVDNRKAKSAIFEIREVLNSEGTRYKFLLEQKGKRYHLTVQPDGTIEEIVKVKP